MIDAERLLRILIRAMIMQAGYEREDYIVIECLFHGLGIDLPEDWESLYNKERNRLEPILDRTPYGAIMTATRLNLMTLRGPND